MPMLPPAEAFMTRVPEEMQEAEPGPFGVAGAVGFVAIAVGAAVWGFVEMMVWVLRWLGVGG